MQSSGPVKALAMPILFVIIWATGFIVARLVAPHIEPLTFMLGRYMGAGIVLAIIAIILKAPWPDNRRDIRNSMIAGILLHGIYLGGVFWAVKHGMPSGIAALVAGLQPIATAALVGPLLGEKVSRKQWSGVLIGLCGACLVIVPKLGGQNGFTFSALIVCLCAMFSITFGTIWQKKNGASINLVTNTVVQYIAAFIVTLPVALMTETMQFEITTDLFLGWFWSVFGLSIGAILLLLTMIRKGAVASVASIIYLVPPTSALMAYFIFREELLPLQIVGMAIAATGVAIALKGQAR
ncbi:DMT family transporter [Microvirga sp. W0021]|uniref:DMT family transporter n=1 Tax=Hohaiivirga grylli TaxID=3133970 RepID=A0ABV0BMZ4_9HYPH